MNLIPWIGNLFIVLGLWKLGSKNRKAFIFSMLGEATWVLYATSIRMWPMAFICVVFFTLAARNFVVWGQE